ncbi:MAG: hypothetical protein AB7O59_16150 [Pirellulales bacterium]
MFSLSATVLVALATMAAAADKDVPTLTHQQLAVGQEFVIRTTDAAYRGQLVDRATGECRMAVSADGKNFGEPRTMYLLGATAGPQARQMLVLMHEVKVGLKMELGVGDLDARHRHITGEVTSIRLGS